MADKIAGFELTVQIHKDHDLVTQVSNVANAETTILKVTPGENQVLIFPRGNPLRMKLYDTNGSEFSEGAVISFWRVDETGQIQECFATTLYALWKNISISDQFDEDYKETLGIGFVERFQGDAIHIAPGYHLEIRVKNSTVIDWNNANTKIFFGLAQELLK